MGTLKFRHSKTHSKRWLLFQKSSQYVLLKSVCLEWDLNAVSSLVKALNIWLEKTHFFSFFFFFLLNFKSFQNIYKILKWAFIIFPQFCLGQGLIELSYNQIKFDITSNFGIDSYISPFEMNFLGWIFVEMALQGTVLLLLRLFFHWDLHQKPRCVCYHLCSAIVDSWLIFNVRNW